MVPHGNQGIKDIAPDMREDAPTFTIPTLILLSSQMVVDCVRIIAAPSRSPVIYIMVVGSRKGVRRVGRRRHSV